MKRSILIAAMSATVIVAGCSGASDDEQGGSPVPTPIESADSLPSPLQIDEENSTVPLASSSTETLPNPPQVDGDAVAVSTPDESAASLPDSLQLEGDNNAGQAADESAETVPSPPLLGEDDSTGPTPDESAETDPGSLQTEADDSTVAASADNAATDPSPLQIVQDDSTDPTPDESAEADPDSVQAEEDDSTDPTPDESAETNSGPVQIDEENSTDPTPTESAEAPPSLIQLNARRVATEMLEVIDVVEYLARRVSPFATKAGVGQSACISGSAQATLEAGTTTITFEQCKPSNNSAVQISGTLSSVELPGADSIASGVKNAASFQLQYTGLALSLDNVKVTASGAVTLHEGSEELAVASDQLSLSGSLGVSELTGLGYSREPGAASSVLTSIEYGAALSNSDGFFQVATTQGMVSEDLAICFSAGQMQARDSGGTTLDLIGQPGENLLFSTSEASDTIGCAEVSSFMAETSSGSVFLPPVPPG